MRGHATKLYLSTIRNLQSSLRSSNWRDPMVMYTAMILTLYERGPQSFVDGLEHKTFRYYRINILLLYLADRQPCFLAEADWKSIPFSGDCPPKSVSDLLLDILVEIPGVLAAVEAMKKGELGRYAPIQNAFEMTLWVRRLIYNLERWKEDYIWTYPTICSTPTLKNIDIIALCNLGTNMVPYDVKLAEVINLYATAHLILARIAHGLAERSFVFKSALRPPYGLRDLVAAIVLVSQRHIQANSADMVSMIVTAFPLKVAQMTTELNEPALLETVQGLLDRINDQFARRYNISYSVDREAGGYGV
ncbi:hypothetical protein PRZ48_008477 [Zasmidium cellare]|uniref:Uncharacterized protein n=1 Tax=Zasmidium cellare TaxID=395010 RepID=A0ABR0EGU1_ZASCE|nr:hypothetical protein PRZ48_008477 [Zasmidium cellare]